MIKKILALLMALCLGFTIFTACDSNEEDTSDNNDMEESTEVDANATVEKFMDAFVNFDVEEAKKYVDDESFAEKLGVKSKDEYKKRISGKISLSKDSSAKIAEELSCIEYKISKVEEAGEETKYTVTIALKTLDEKSLDEAIKQEKVKDIEKKIKEEMGENVPEEEIHHRIKEKIEDEIVDNIKYTFDESDIVIVVSNDDEKCKIITKESETDKLVEIVKVSDKN